MSVSAKQIKDFLAYGREQAGVEFKSAGPLTDPNLRAKVIRAMLAMANRRDGGIVLVGVSEDDGQPKLDGLREADALTWKHDDLADQVARYADPRVGFHTIVIDVDEARVVVIQIETFDEVPVICKRGLQEGAKNILRDGAVYVRSNRKPETREIANHDEMRELLGIATDRGVRRFVARAHSAGLDVNAIADASAVADTAYSAERGDL